MEPRLGQRLPHPRGGLDGCAGAGVHAGQRVRLRRGSRGGRPRCRRVRRPPVVLLQQPHRLLRGDRQVPGRSTHLGAVDEGALRRAATTESWKLRFHTQTAGVSLTAQQPEINIARVALQALAAVLGGTQSLHTDSYDEALALPTEKAARIALRTQQIVAHETGVTNVADPLGGSPYVEWMTDEMERQAEEVFAHLARARRRLDARRRLRRHRGRLLRRRDRRRGLPLRTRDQRRSAHRGRGQCLHRWRRRGGRPRCTSPARPRRSSCKRLADGQAGPRRRRRATPRSNASAPSPPTRPPTRCPR